MTANDSDTRPSTCVRWESSRTIRIICI